VFYTVWIQRTFRRRRALEREREDPNHSQRYYAREGVRIDHLRAKKM